MSDTSKMRARALLGSAASTLVLAALLQAGLAGSALAQDKKSNSAAAAAAEEGTEVEQVVVTGTFLRGTPATAVIPVEGVNLEEIRDRGSPSATDFIKGLSEVGSIVGEANRVNTFAIGAQTVNLRGLGPGRTVVVFNGRRFPETFSFSAGRFNNIAQIPSAAIGRTEVLKDGGATTYGADAVGGVVNYITRRNLDGVEVTANYRFIKDSDGDYDFSLSAGKVFDKFNIMGVVSYEARSALYLRDRDFLLTDYLINPSPWSFSANPGSFAFQTTTNGTTFTGVTPNATGANLYTGELQMGPTGVLRDPGCLAMGGYAGFSTTPSPVCYNRYYDRTKIVQEQEAWHGYAEANYEFSPRFKVHGEFMYYGLDIPNIPIDSFGRVVANFPLARVSDLPNAAFVAPGATGTPNQSVPNTAGTLNAYFVSGLNPAVQQMVLNQLKNSPGTGGNALTLAQVNAITGCSLSAAATSCTPTSATPGRAALITGSWNPWGAGGNPVPELDVQHNYSKQYRYTIEFSGDLGHLAVGTWDWSFAYTTNVMDYFYRANDMMIDRLQSALNGFGGRTCNGIRAGTAGSTCQFFNPFSSAYSTNIYTGAANPFFVGTGTFAGYTPGQGLQNDPELIRWLYVPVEQDRQGQFDIFDLVVRGDLDYHLWSKEPIQIAMGAQYREFHEINDLSDFADSNETPCATPNYFFCATDNGPLVFARGASLFGFRGDITRRKPVESAFAEIKFPITDTLSAQISTRYEKFFSDHEGTDDQDVVVSQAAVRYQARPWLAFRATGGQSFANADPPGAAVPNRTPDITLAAGLGGTSTYTSFGWSNTALRPERGFNYNLGAVIQVGDVTATVDYYDIKINGVLRAQTAAQIVQAIAVPGTTGANALVQCNSGLLSQNNPVFGTPFIVSPNPCVQGLTTVQQFIQGAQVNFFSQQGQQTLVVNGASQETSGVDLNVRWRKADVLGGDLSADADFSWVLSYERGPYALDGIVVANGFDNGVGSVNLNALKGGGNDRIPQWRGSLGFNYRLGRHNFNWRTTGVASVVNDIDTQFQTGQTAGQSGQNANIPNSNGFVIPSANTNCTLIVTPPAPAGAGTGIYGVRSSPSGGFVTVGWDPCQNALIGTAKKLPATFSSDFTYRLTLPARTTLTLSVNNVFDTEPNFSRDNLGYDAGSGVGPLGRTFKFGVQKNW
jgi:iron complex outermembrane receptor protein